MPASHSASDRPIRWGILATGGIARKFAADLLLDGHVMTAVGSRSAESAAAFAREFGIARAHGSYADLVADPDVDIVYVASPHTFHEEHGALALQAGKHVLIEKPITVNAGQARRLAALAADRGLLLMEAMWTRYLPHVQRIREVIAAGTIGTVTGFLADHSQNLTTDPAHRINALELGGGALLDLGIYPISFAAGLFGKPTTVQALATFGATGADTHVSVVLQYDGGAIASTYSTSRSRGPNTAAILGTDGRIEMASVWYAPSETRVFDGRNRLVETFDWAVAGRGMQFQAREAEQLIRSGRIESEILTPAACIDIMETLDEVRRQIGVRYPGER